DGKTVETVDSGLPAARAGIRPGQRIDLGRLTPSYRSAIIGGYLPEPGEIVTIGIVRGNRLAPVTLRAEPEQTVGAFIVIRDLVFLVPLLIGIFLVLLRPSPITWGFFLFSLAAGGTPPTSVFSSRMITDWNWYVAVGDVQALLAATLPKMGLVLFAFSLPGRPLSLWARAAIVTAL